MKRWVHATTTSSSYKTPQLDRKRIENGKSNCRKIQEKYPKAYEVLGR